MKQAKQQSGFTIVELLIVIVIIGTLSTLGFIAYKNATGKAQSAVTKSIISQYSRAINMFVAENNEFPQGKVLPQSAIQEIGDDYNALNRFCLGSGYKSHCGPSTEPVNPSTSFDELLQPYAGKPINISPHDTPLIVDPGGGMRLEITGAAYYYNTEETDDTLDGERVEFAFMLYALDEPDAQCIGGEVLSLASMEGDFLRHKAKNTLTDGKNTACAVLFSNSVTT
jgi:prepilin-type N-terminal cleavage/methylation domain-containing protein